MEDAEKRRIRKRNYAKTDKQRDYRREYMRKWREQNREKYNAWAKEYNKNNGYKWETHTKEWKKYYSLKKKYNLTEEDFLYLLEKQQNKCYICGKHNSDILRGLAVDHDHITGKIRGLLCSKCNGALGWYENNFEKINEYLANDKMW